MPTARTVLAAAVLLLAAPAAAQLANHSISVESGASLSLSRGAAAEPAFALAVTSWLEGSAEAVARVALSSAPGTDGRAPDRALCGTIGVRFSLLPDPVRPQVTVDLGWARLESGGAAQEHFAFGAGAGVEWFAAHDVSIAARATLRGIGTSVRGELTLGASAYF